MVQAVGSILGEVGGALSKQSSKDVSRPAMPPSVTSLVATAKTKKTANLIKDTSREERIFTLLSQPEVLGMLMTFGGIYAAQKIKFSDNEVVQEGLQATATGASVLMGLGHAGVGDLTTLAIAVISAGFSLTELFTDIISGSGDWKNPLTWKWPFGPIWNQ